jgi:hypothetical protein
MMGTLDEDVFIFMIVSRCILLQTRSVSYNCSENQTHVLRSIIFTEIVPFLNNVKNYGTAK